MVFLLALFLVISVLAKRLAGKIVSDMTYIVSSWTLSLNSISQSLILNFIEYEVFSDGSTEVSIILCKAASS